MMLPKGAVIVEDGLPEGAVIVEEELPEGAVIVPEEKIAPSPVDPRIAQREQWKAAGPIGVGEFSQRFLKGAEKIPFFGLVAGGIARNRLQTAVVGLQELGPKLEAIEAEEADLNARFPDRELLDIDTKEQIEDRIAFLAQQRKLFEDFGDTYIARLQEWQERNEEIATRGTTIPADIFGAVTDLASFMVEFAASGGFASFGKSIAKRAAILALRKTAAKGLVRKGVKVAGRVAATTLGGLARTVHPIQLARVAERTGEQVFPQAFEFTEDGKLKIAKEGKQPLNAFINSFADVAIENISEMAGEGFAKAARSVFGRVKRLPRAGRFVKRFSGWLAAKYPSKSRMAVALDRVGWNGFIGEWFEEDLGGALRAITGVDDKPGGLIDRLAAFGKENWDFRNMIVRAATLAVPTAGFGALGAIARRQEPTDAEMAARQVGAPSPEEGVQRPPEGEVRVRDVGEAQRAREGEARPVQVPGEVISPEAEVAEPRLPEERVAPAKPVEPAVEPTERPPEAITPPEAPPAAPKAVRPIEKPVAAEKKPWEIPLSSFPTASYQRLQASLWA